MEGSGGAGMTLTVFSCGAGKQSSAIAILIAEAALPRPDAAIFSDTGWEPEGVYRQVDRIEALLADVDVPLYRVSRGNLRDDVLDPYRQAAIPAFTLGVWREQRNVLESIPCPEGCGWTPEIRKDMETQLDAVRADGADLVAAWAAVRTQWPAGCDRCDNTGRLVIKWNGELVRDRGSITRRCTGRYKVEPIEQKVRELLGAKVSLSDCRYCGGTGQRVPPWDLTLPPGPCSVCKGTSRRRRVGSVPKGAKAEQWIGFSTDEAGRVSNKRDDGEGGTEGFPSYITPRYPLLDLGLSRKDCERMLTSYGWGDTIKSACVGCPYHGNAAWRDMRDNRPEDWAAAVAFDEQFRRAPGLDGERYLHASRIPLSIAPIDRVTRKEAGEAQTDLFDALADNDDPDGCSPYGCRSGAAA